MHAVQSALQKLGLEYNEAKITALHGGDIGLSYKIEFKHRAYFLKMPKLGSPELLLEAEWCNLTTLTEIIPESIPRIRSTQGHSAFGILLDFIPSEQKTTVYWEKLARVLAKLHRKKSDKFGLQRSNFIGTIPQPNTNFESFASYYANACLLYMFERVHKLFNPKLSHLLEKLCKMLPDIIPEEKPTLVHGDLWRGNILCGPNQQPFVFDPACYFGHREADIAMSKLFGGFDAEFYLAYQEANPLQPKWQNRLDLFQLYPLLVHANLFGAQYVPSCESIISKYS